MSTLNTSAPESRTAAPAPARINETDAVGVDVLSELNRGATFGRTLTTSMRGLLDSLVTPELIREKTVIDAGSVFAPFRRVRNRRRIDRLVAMRFVRRDGGYLRPTIAGIGAVRPFTAAGGHALTGASVTSEDGIFRSGAAYR